MPIAIEHVDFITVPTRDVERARQFYVETLGLELERETPVGIEVAAGQVTLGIWNPESMGLKFTPTPNPMGLGVADVEAARRQLTAAGVEFEGETLDTGVCHMALFSDPDGNSLMLHRRYEPA